MAARRRRPPTDGPMVARFIEDYCVHVKGFAGPVIPEPWQRDFLDLAFETDPKTGLRVYREVLLGIPRGNSKSTTCAGVGLYLLVADDEPGPQVLSAAGKKDQAREVHGVARTMAKLKPELADYLDTRNTDEIRSPENNGVWGIITSSGELEQGSNPSGAVVDELHVHKNGDLYNAIYSGAITKRRQPLIASITTAGPDKDTFCGEVYDRMLKAPDVERPHRFLQIAKDREAGYAMVWYGIPDDEMATVDLDDPSVWTGCNPASWVGEKTLRAARNSPFMDPTKFTRFHCNGWQKRGSSDGIPEDMFDACADPDFRLPAGTEVIVGIDGGWRNDWTVVFAVGYVGDRVGCEAHMFAPTADQDVDLDEAIVGTILQMGQRLSVMEAAADPSSIMSIVQALQREGVPVWEFTQSVKNKVRASIALWKALKSGQLLHDGNEDMREHFLNARMVDTQSGDWYFAKPMKKNTESIDGDKKIDALVAAMMAVDRLMVAEGNAYETEGFSVL